MKNSSSNSSGGLNVSRLLEQIAMEGAPGIAKPQPASFRMLVGSAGRDVIILGEVPPNALEVVMGRRAEGGGG